MQRFAKTCFMISLAVSCQAFASKTIVPFAPKPVATVPTNCQLMKLGNQSQNIVLNGPREKNKSQVYFIKNKSKKSIWLDHPIKHTGASAGWSSYLQTDKWSAVAVDKKEFAVSCAVIHPGKIENLNCAEALAVCMPGHDVTASRKGTYWVVENKSLDDVQNYFKGKK